MSIYILIYTWKGETVRWQVRYVPNVVSILFLRPQMGENVQNVVIVWLYQQMLEKVEEDRNVLIVDSLQYLTTNAEIAELFISRRREIK